MATDEISQAMSPPNSWLSDLDGLMSDVEGDDKKCESTNATQKPAIQDQIREEAAEFAKQIAQQGKDRMKSDAVKMEKAEDPEIARWAALSEAGVEIRSPEGQKFSRDKEGGKSEEYQELTSYSEKQEFRRKWAAKIYEKVKASKTRTQEWSRIDTKKGSYLGFGRVLWEEGLDAEGLEATKNYTKACVDMGAPWVRFNGMSKRVEFLYVRQEYVEEFQDKWRMYEQWEKSKDVKSDARGTKRPSKDTAKTASDSQDVKAEEGKEDTEMLKKKSKKKSEATHEKATFDKAWGRAQTTKKTFQAVVSKAKLILENIEGAQQWQWCKGSFAAEQLKSMVDQISKDTSTEFRRSFLSMDAKSTKNMMPQKELMIAMGDMYECLDTQLDKMAKQVAMISRMHQAHLKA